MKKEFIKRRMVPVQVAFSQVKKKKKAFNV